MKLTRIFAIGLATFALAACSDDSVSYNTESDVTVEFGEATFDADEDDAGTMYNIPIVVNGETNGEIRVTVELEETGAEPAMEDVHYLVTSKSIRIPKGKKTGYIEFRVTGDEEINPDRTFDVKIVDVKGAKVGATNICEVTLADDDYLKEIFYQAVQGTYAFSTSSGQDFVVNVYGYTEDDELYLKELIVTGILEDDSEATAYFSVNGRKGTANIDIQFGEPLAAYDFGQIGPQFVVLGGVGFNEAGQLVSYDLTGTARFSSNTDFSKFECNASLGFWLLEYPSGAFSGYIYDYWDFTTMTRISEDM